MNKRVPPPPPPDRIISEGVGVFCKRCGSTMSRSWIFGKRRCDNKDCFGDRSSKLDNLLK